jgi:hypothetical protein
MNAVETSSCKGSLGEFWYFDAKVNGKRMTLIKTKASDLLGKNVKVNFDRPFGSCNSSTFKNSGLRLKLSGKIFAIS